MNIESGTETVGENISSEGVVGEEEIQAQEGRRILREMGHMEQKKNA